MDDVPWTGKNVDIVPRSCLSLTTTTESAHFAAQNFRKLEKRASIGKCLIKWQNILILLGE